MTLDSKRYRDVYAPDLRLQGLLGYGLGERVEIIARGTYYKADGTALEVGKLGDDPVYVFFDPYGEYEEVGVELGLRFYIAAAGRLKSYVAPIVGARWLSETYVTFDVPDAGSAIRNVPFHEKSTVPVFGLDLGFTFDLGEHFFVGVDTGLRYQSRPVAGRRAARPHADRRQRRQVVLPGRGVDRRQVLMPSRGTRVGPGRPEVRRLSILTNL